MNDDSYASLRRASIRGSIIGFVISAHIMLLALAISAESNPTRMLPYVEHGRPSVIFVELLEPIPTIFLPHPPKSTISTARLKPKSVIRKRSLRVNADRVIHKVQAAPAASEVQVTRGPLRSATAAESAPAFIAGGGFYDQLRHSQAAAPVPKLPGGHQYLHHKLAFVPVEQQSLAGKVHEYAGIFGWFDPVCADAKLELAKPREQILQDGFTVDELQRRLRERHCQ